MGKCRDHGPIPSCCIFQLTQGLSEKKPGKGERGWTMGGFIGESCVKLTSALRALPKTWFPEVPYTKRAAKRILSRQFGTSPRISSADEKQDAEDDRENRGDAEDSEASLSGGSGRELLRRDLPQFRFEKFHGFFRILQSRTGAFTVDLDGRDLLTPEQGFLDLDKFLWRQG